MVSTRERVLEVIRSYTLHYGWPPTVREIGERVGLSATSSVLWHLRRLERDGLIERGNGPRQIRVKEETKSEC